MAEPSTEFLALKQATIKVLHQASDTERFAKSIRRQLEQGKDEAAAYQSIHHILTKLPLRERQRINGTRQALEAEIRAYRQRP